MAAGIAPRRAVRKEPAEGQQLLLIVPNESCHILGPCEIYQTRSHVYFTSLGYELWQLRRIDTSAPLLVPEQCTPQQKAFAWSTALTCPPNLGIL